MALPAEKARSLVKRLPAAPLLLPGLLLLLFANLTSLAYATTAADETLSLFEQRALYRQALDDLRLTLSSCGHFFNCFNFTNIF